ncbi:MAG: hypothetical protein WBZ20_16405, partial [Nitrososphaeraceae archaeon]
KNYHGRPIIFALIAFSIASMIMASIINNTNNVNNNLLAFAKKMRPGGSTSGVSTSTATTTTTTTDPKKKSTSLPSSDNSGGGGGTSGNGNGINGNSGGNGSSDGRGGKGGTGTTITTRTGNPPPPPPPVKCKSGEVLKGGVCVPKPTPTTSPCPKGTHNVVTLGCVKNHLTSQEEFGLGCKMGFSDGPDQENYVGTGGIKHHSKAFTQGYNLAFGSGNTGACKRYLGNN